MLVTSSAVRERLNIIWPGIYVLNTDMQYTVPTKKEFFDTAVRAKSQINATIKKSYINRIYECEDICKVIAGRVIEIRVSEAITNNIKTEDFYSWPFGLCFGTKFYEEEAEHWAIVIYTSDSSVYLLDSQTMNFWEASYVSDNVLFALI